MTIRNVHEHKKGDDTLFGLLLVYKANYTYVRILESQDEKRMAVIITDNPRNWKNITEENLTGYHDLKRLEIGNTRLFVKYLIPENLIKVMGPELGLKFPKNAQVNSKDRLSSKGYYMLDVPLKYKKRVLQGINKILNLSSQKKYEIIEKFIADNLEQGG